MIKRIKFLFLIAILFPCALKAQVPADEIRNELMHINSSYDSAFFLSFDVNMSYSSDTTGNGDFDNSEINGRYTLHGKYALYLLDNIEYMQNEKYAIAVYKNDKFILVDKPRAISSGSLLPYRQMLDSFMTNADSLYTFDTSYSAGGLTKSVICTSKNIPASIYESIQLEYDPVTYRMRKITYLMKETMGEYSIDNVGYANARKARFVISFSKYRVDEIGPEVFDESKYLFFISPKEPEASGKYKGYTIHNNLNLY